MNINRLVNMVVRQVVRQVINKGVRAGMNKASGTPPPIPQDKAAQRRMRQSAKMMKRVTRF